MKRNFLSLVVFLTALTITWLAYGQGSNTQSREGQKGGQNLSAEERAKLLEERQSLSEEENQKSRVQRREQIIARSPIFERQEQLKIIEGIEQQLAKLKEAVRNAPSREEFRKLPGASPEQQIKFRDQWQKARKQQEQMVSAIQQQLTTLAGPRQPARITRSDLFVNELKLIYEIAIKEQAKITAERIEKLITKYQKQQEDQPDMTIQQERPRRDIGNTGSGKSDTAETN
jgi:hypothetical protein